MKLNGNIFYLRLRHTKDLFDDMSAKGCLPSNYNFFQTMVKYLAYFVKSHSVFKLGIYMLGSHYKKMYIRKSILRYLKPEAIKVGNLSNCPELLSAVREKKRQS